MSTGRVAIVTGGTGGVGSAVCRLLVDDGYRVVFSYRSGIEGRDALLAELGERATAVRVELDDPGTIRELIDTAAAIGPIGALVHAGGPLVPQRYVSRIEPEEFDRHVRQELSAAFALTHEALPQLRETAGSIVVVTTVAVRRSPIKDVLSASPKAGVEALVRAIAQEEGRFGIRANCVGPGIMADGMAASLESEGHFTPEVQAQVARSIPLRRFGTTREVAEVVAFLVSDRASYVSGQVIDVDGGYRL